MTAVAAAFKAASLRRRLRRRRRRRRFAPLLAAAETQTVLNIISCRTNIYNFYCQVTFARATLINLCNLLLL